MYSSPVNGDDPAHGILSNQTPIDSFFSKETAEEDHLESTIGSERR